MGCGVVLKAVWKRIKKVTSFRNDEGYVLEFRVFSVLGWVCRELGRVGTMERGIKKVVSFRNDVT